MSVCWSALIYAPIAFDVESIWLSSTSWSLISSCDWIAASRSSAFNVEITFFCCLTDPFNILAAESKSSWDAAAGSNPFNLNSISCLVAIGRDFPPPSLMSSLSNPGNPISFIISTNRFALGTATFLNHHSSNAASLGVPYSPITFALLKSLSACSGS